MTRIVGGTAGGRRLAVPPGRGTRPTSDRAREALFSALEARTGGLTGCRVLDLYAGSGAVGLEALSRGAAAAVLVESDPGALRVLRENVAALRLPGATVLGRSVAAVLAEPAPEPFDVVFADPPYVLPGPELAALLAGAIERGWVAEDAVVVVERATRDPAWEWPAGLAADRDRKYGEATLWYGRATPIRR
ncbi:16S rRNA (guanine(966)-N(2))-methyltransferase RsmD [Sporichthya brevicatena]|uniref:16S rRNA (Guanine(966)-N(2))-methyltransferase RsmD n=1 Tax=Sporichthya brevicatena TaxID=171442 RepID=A0ABN1H8H5_9ACTN